MADPNLLAAILSGQDPLAGQMLPGYQGAQLSNAALNPEFGHNEGIAGALAKTLAGFTGSPAMNQAVQNTTQARIAAQPNLARLLAQPDPYQAFAQNPQQYGPIAGAGVLAGATPESVADARLKAAQGAFFNAKANYATQQLGGPMPPMYGNSGTAALASVGSGSQGKSVDPRGLVPFIAQTAEKYGIDPAVAVKVAASEGLSAPAGPSGDGGTSGNAFQLHVTPGGKGDAVGDQFIAQTGLNPLDPANEKATIDFALRHASQNGWGAWAGAQKAGITPFQGIPRPAASGAPGASPGAAAVAAGGQQPINPAYIAAAQQRANAASALGETPPQYINEAAGIPFVGPQAAAKAWGSAPAELYVKRNTPEVVRPGGIFGSASEGPLWGAPVMKEFVNPDGSKFNALVDPITGRMTGTTQTGGATQQPQGQPQSAGTSQPQAAQPQAAISALSPAQVEEQKQTGEEVAKRRQENIDHAQTAQTQNALINRMKLDVGNFPQGPLGPKQSEFQAYLRYFDPTFNEPVATAEEFNKNAGIILRQAVHETSNRAAVQEYNLIGKTLPAQQNSPIGTIRVLNEFQGLNDYMIAKNQAQGAWLQSHNNSAQGFETDWQSRVSPDAFILNRMTPQDRQTTIQQLQKTDDGRATLKTLAGQMSYLKSTGLEKAIQ